MIASPDRTVVVSSLGWVEGDGLWMLRGGRAEPETVALGSGARYVSPRAGSGGRFSLAHHFDGRRFEVTVRAFAAPAEILARAWIDEGGQGTAGDLAAWADVPCLHVAYLGWAPWRDFVLVRVVPSTGALTVQRLEWYDRGYDKDYQGVVDVVELPGELALVSVQRSSELVLHDLATGAARARVPLRGRGGNPRLVLRGETAWASDYDTLVRLDGPDWRVEASRRLQSAFTGTQAFIGDFAFAGDGTRCVVARPFSGDVVAVDTGTLRVKAVARLGGQPIEVAALEHGDVVARDWKTGALLRGRLERRPWWRW